MPIAINGTEIPIDPDHGIPYGSSFTIDYAIGVTPWMLMLLVGCFLLPFLAIKLASKMFNKQGSDLLAITMSLLIGWSALFFIYVNPEVMYPVAGCDRAPSVYVDLPPGEQKVFKN